ncbi:MAG TPA: 50S ribosomal protein L25 [Candidatus Parcubacteria bacterium]|jgi:large subunit ribosomal protein L25|nr:50S ribosomal protein L25 [Candidatus Parcubacteria bacterium]
MISLTAKIRKTIGKKIKALLKEGVLPAVLYGPGMKTVSLEVDLKDFEKTFKEAGRSSLISLETEGKKEKNLTLIQSVQRHPLTGKPIHVDFYQPNLKEKIEARVPIILDGEAPAVKDLGGTLVKTISEVNVKALPQNLPKEIRISVEGLKTFEDNIFIKDLKTGEGIEILKKPEEIVARVTPPEKVEEELAKPIEEKVEDVEKVGEKKEEGEKVEKEEEEKKPSSAKVQESKEEKSKEEKAK